MYRLLHTIAVFAGADSKYKWDTTRHLSQCMRFGTVAKAQASVCKCADSKSIMALESHFEPSMIIWYLLEFE